MTFNNSLEYFAAASSEEIGSALQAKIDIYYAYLTGAALVDLWRKSFYAYYGMIPQSAMTGFGMFAIGTIVAGGSEGELAKVKINHLRNLITHQLTMTTGNRPALECRARNSDSKSLAQATLGDGIVDYYMREKSLEQHLKDAVELALVFGEGFVRLDWNENGGSAYAVGPDGGQQQQGDVYYRTYNPFDIIRDTTRVNAIDQDWFITHDVSNRFDEAAKYPHVEDELLNVSTDITSARRFIDPTKVIPSAGIGTRETDLIDVYTFMHKPTRALPAGRLTKIAQGGLVLFDGPFPFRAMPLHRISGADIIGSTFGWTLTFDILGIQELIDKLYSVVATNQLASGIQNFWQPPGNQLSKTQIAGGLNLLESVVKPEVLELCQTPAEIFNFITKLESVCETLSGVSAVNRGATPDNLKSGSALAFVAAQTVAFNSGLQGSYARLLENVGSSLVDILKDYAKIPQVAVIAGEFNRPLLKEFVGSDLEPISRVVVDAVSPMSKTTAGKIQIAQDLLGSGLIRNAREYLTVVNTGTLDPLTEGEMSEIILARAENEDLRSGKQVKALFFDDHKFHFLEHRAILGSGARDDPMLVQNVGSHIQEHLSMYGQLQANNPMVLAMMGEPPMPQPQPPGGPVQKQLNATPQAQQQAAEIKKPRMPTMPQGADQASSEAYQQMQPMLNQ